MLLDALNGRRVLFVGGKGGVGKTSVSSAIALARASEGARVLLVSTDPAHNLGHLWDRPVGDEPVRLATPRHGAAGDGSGSGGFVDGIEIDPQRMVDRHLAAVGETMRRMLPERMQPHAKRHLQLAREAPGSHEAAVLERVADAVSLGLEAYDLVVFDTAPSGHTLRLMALPEQLSGWTETLLANRDRSERFSAAMQSLASGREQGRSPDADLRRTLLARRERFALLHRTVTDAEQTGFVVVCVAERMPVAETIELAHALERIGVNPAALVANRRSPADAGPLLADRRRAEERQLAVLEESLPSIPLFQLPLFGGELFGETGLRELAEALR